jgi:multidrug efflux system outer membrane protein
VTRLRAAAALSLALGLAAATGCAVGPNYARPELPTTPTFRDAPEQQASIADLPWWEVFKDETLQSLVKESLEKNRELAAAVSNVEQSRDIAAVQRGELFPQVGYLGNASRGKQTSISAFDTTTSETSSVYAGALNAAWEVDIWGRIRRATEASKAEMLASDAVRRGVVLSLVTGVAQAYLELRELDLELEIANRTVQSFQSTFELFGRQFRGGVTSKLDSLRAEAALAQAQSTVPLVEQRIRAKENQLAVLLGRTPGPIPRGESLLALSLPPEIPAGVPSLLLERRPDLIEAEQSLVAANAQIGVAVADFFPRLGLTTLYGSATTELDDFLKSGTGAWSRAAAATGPLVTFGRNWYAWESAEAGAQSAIARYQHAVLAALADVSNALTAREKVTAQRVALERQVAALQESVRLAEKRYVGGLSTYLEVLDAQQQLFPAELALAQAQRDERLVLVDLYRALGGGWSQAGEQPSIPQPFMP